MKTISIILFFSNLLFSAPGDIKWQYNTGASQKTSPSTYENSIFEISGGSCLYNLNANNGQLNWRKDYMIEGSPKIYKNMIYCYINQKLTALNAQDGEILWIFDDLPYGYPPEGSPYIYNDLLYVSGKEWYYSLGKIYELDSNTGKYLRSFYWVIYNPSEPAVVDDILIVNSRDDTTYAYNMTTSSIIWKFDGCRTYGSAPCIENGIVYIGGYHLYALNAYTGSKNWEYDSGGTMWGTPIYYKGTILAANAALVCAVNASTGELKWKYITDGLTEKPAVSGGVVYFGSQDRRCYAVDEITGVLKWSYRTGNWVTCTPCFYEKLVVFTSHDDNIYAFETENTGFSSSKSSSSLPSKSFSVSPNPFTDRLTISLPSSGAIYSLTGQLIVKLDKGKHSIDTNKWKQGVYIIKNNRIVKRIVKIKD